jgi:hypothetical protein
VVSSQATAALEPAFGLDHPWVGSLGEQVMSTIRPNRNTAMIFTCPPPHHAAAGTERRNPGARRSTMRASPRSVSRTAWPARHASGTRRRRPYPVGSPKDSSLPSGSTSRQSRIP